MPPGYATQHQYRYRLPGSTGSETRPFEGFNIETQPEPVFYEDEGGKKHYLTCEVRSDVPPSRGPLRAELLYEDDTPCPVGVLPLMDDSSRAICGGGGATVRFRINGCSKDHKR